MLGGHGSFSALPTQRRHQSKTPPAHNRPRPACRLYFTHSLLWCLVVVFFPTIKTSRGELTLDFHDLALAVILGIAGLVAPAFVFRLSAPVTHNLLEHENLETA